MSDDLAGVLFRHRERLKEIGNVLSRYGFARLAPRSDLPARRGNFGHGISMTRTSI
jgi:hypothetical protein